ncbi:MAG: DNA polymerase III subunit delta [Phycisphaeraceae bacterium]
MAKKKTTTRKAASPAVSADTRILVLHGPEQMVMQEHLDALKAALDDAHGGFETFRFDGKSATLADVFDEVRGYSLMSAYKLVIVDDADEYLKKDGYRQAVERYADGPVDHATLVLRAGKWNKGNLDKKVAKIGAVIKCDAPKPAEAARWLVERAKSHHKAELKQNAAGALVDRVGPHLMLLDAELGKLAVMAAGTTGNTQSVIDLALVEQAVGQSSDAKMWVMQEPLLIGMARGSAREPLEMVRELLDLAGHDAVPVTWAALDLCRKLAVAWAMKSAGDSEQAIGKAMRLWGPQTRPFMDVVRRLDSVSATTLLQTALRTDARTKRGLGTARRNLEALCVALTDK